ncbi:unnamed protein product [Didymodactylos carnosus]|uniref:cystathionine gamma-lyase n=2 Tax=Didymodactylos carnosus TaxID=1234261 RepID=A0A814PRH8_9BILA|nr:unnamed protein product [Didymodactylos carnosus]CAF1109719.1 unnamed protein product [Didymodactylos carnosus]CAF3874219.1 unnamed protein product [Didymodactylos carnosus]CAF3874236.1 unnamed protein product [Didymodactylos carnosus]
MGAISSTFLTLLSAGDHIVIARSVYGGCYELLTTYGQNLGFEVSFVDATDISNYAKEIKSNTKVLYAETPCNPTMRVTDLYSLGQLSMKYGQQIKVVVDGTFATPYHTRALNIPGIDIIIHSATKYLGGHSDLTAGCVSSNDKSFLSKLTKTMKLFGCILSAYDGMLLMRGIKTLDVRMQRHNENAQYIAEYLSTHPFIDVVHYPGLTTHPDHVIAKRQMNNGFGGMISFEVKGGAEAGRAVVEHLKLINLAVSLGSIESLICHPASMTHGMVPSEVRINAGIKDGLIRFSIGIEDKEDIKKDLDQALEYAKPFIVSD